MSTPAAAALSPSAPMLEHVLTVRASITAPLIMGKTPLGERRMIPISGGTFEGRGLRGIILPGGEDWQLVRPDGVTELDARYWLQTDDGVVIRVNNQALVAPRNAAGVQPPVRSVVRLEAPIGKYDWLNQSVAVGTLTIERSQQPTVVLWFYRVI